MRNHRTHPTHSAGAGSVAINLSDDTEMTSLTGQGFSKFLRLYWIGTDLPKITITKAVFDKRTSDLQLLLNASLESDCAREIQENLLLHVAVKNNAVEILRLLLNVLKDDDLLFLKDLEDRTALHWAVECKHEECCEVILERNSLCLVQKDGSGDTPLHYVARNKFTEGCRLAMEYATEKHINVINNKNLTPLHVAARENNKVILEMLLNNGASPESKTKHNYTALHFATDCGFVACVKALVDAVPDKKKYMDVQTRDGTSALILAAKKGFSECVRVLRDTNVNLYDNKGNTALHYAASKGYFSVVKFLIEELQADVSIKNKSKETALYFAASSYNEECLSYLLENTELTETKEALLKVATVKNCFKCLELMLLRDDLRSAICHQFPSDDNNTLLHISLKRGYYKITQLLLNNGAKKDLVNKNYEYPLHLAAEQKKLESRSAEEERLEVCKQILKGSHDLVNNVNVKSESPLHLAAKSGNVDMIRSLLRKGSKVLSLEENGWTTVHVAARYGHDRCIKMLVRSLNSNQCKELVKIRPHPLHLIAQYGHLQSCQMILQEFKTLNSSLSIVDKYDQYPVDLAYKHNKFDVFRYLLKEMKYDPVLEEFSCRLHRYCKQSILERNRAVFEAVIDSPWCHVAFDGYYCDWLRRPVREHLDEDVLHGRLKPCDSFSELVKAYPQTACKVMDRHITLTDDEMEEIHNYMPFEFIYYNIEDDKVKPSFHSLSTCKLPACTPNGVRGLKGAGTANTSQTSVIPQSPLSPAANLGSFSALNNLSNSSVTQGTLPIPVHGPTQETINTVKSSAKTFQHVTWGRNHPLLKASEGGHTDVLSHRLTRSWLHCKFEAYARWLLYTYVSLDLITAIMVAVMFSTIMNTNHLEAAFSGASKVEVTSVSLQLPFWSANDTVQAMLDEVRSASTSDKSCSQFSVEASDVASTFHGESFSKYPNIPAGSAEWNRSVCAITNLETRIPKVVALYVAVTLILALHVFLEVNFIVKMRRVSCDLFDLMRSLRMLSVFAVLFVTCRSDFLFGLREVWVWQIGVLCVLMAVLNLVSTLNKVPAFTVFMPVTNRFVFNYLKVIMHVVLIIFAFALSFHFLLSDASPAFSTLPYAIIKTLVWMLGDLGYDDTFLQEDAPLKYPAEANLLFVLFVTTIGGLVFNLILRDPTDQLQDIKDKANFHQADGSLKLHLLIDDCFPNLRRSYATSQRVVPLGVNRRNSSIFYSRLPSVVYKESSRAAIAGHSFTECKLPHFKNTEEEDNDTDELRNTLKLLVQKLDSQKEDINELSRKVANLTK